MDMKYMLAAEGDRKVGYRSTSYGNTPIALEVRSVPTGRACFAYLTPEMALELADFILANVERPKPKTAADQIRELPIGGKFRFTDSQYPAVNVRITDRKFYHGPSGYNIDINSYDDDYSRGIEVIE